MRGCLEEGHGVRCAWGRRGWGRAWLCPSLPFLPPAGPHLQDEDRGSHSLLEDFRTEALDR